ncbi:MAG: hypothetical protein AAGE59_23225 [Cyanobacteria bacterium P01_F01_bin.86]
MNEVAQVEEFCDSETMVACLDNVVGFVSWNGSYITWLYVKPSVQQRGVGGKLPQHDLQQIGPDA